MGVSRFLVAFLQPESCCRSSGVFVPHSSLASGGVKVRARVRSKISSRSIWAFGLESPSREKEMPCTGVFEKATHTRRDELLAFPTDEADLLRYYTFNTYDLAVIRRRRGEREGSLPGAILCILVETK